MISRRNLFGAAGAIVVGQAVAGNPALSSERGRYAEVLTFRDFAQKTHPLGAIAEVDEGWRQSWASLAKSADTLSDGDYFISLRKALGWFKDGHTTVLPFQFTGGVPGPIAKGPFRLNLPLKIRAFHDALLVTEAAGGALPLLGASIERIGLLTVAEFMRRITAGWPGNDAWAHRWSAEHAAVPAFLHALGATKNLEAPINFVGKTPEGRLVEASIQSINSAPASLRFVERKETQIERWLREAHGKNFVRRAPESKSLLLCIEAMEDFEGQSFVDFSRGAIADLAAPGAERLIVDLRRNGGGNNFLFEPLRKSILASQFNSPGRLLVLTGVRTFSAAQNLATRLERDSHALFVGEPTGGAPNHFGDAKVFQGNVTGLTAIVSTLPWSDSYPMDRRVWIMPDLLAPDLSSDWLAGRDAALKLAVETPPAPVSSRDFLTMDRTFYFRRPSQDTKWNPFWRS